MEAETPIKLTTLKDSDMTLADSGEDVRGQPVLDRDGLEIGTVDALMLDEAESKVRFLRVAAGGFLGIGERQFLIPVEAVTRIDKEHVHVDHARAHVADAPAYDPNLVYEEGYYGNLYGHYGYDPYWRPGRIAPVSPYFRQ